METKHNSVPIWQKYALTIDEAADYYGIGQKKLRQIVADNKDNDFYLEIGNRTLLKRCKFETYLDKCSTI